MDRYVKWITNMNVNPCVVQRTLVNHMDSFPTTDN
jgi:hypothetical protein